MGNLLLDRKQKVIFFMQKEQWDGAASAEDVSMISVDSVEQRTIALTADEIQRGVEIESHIVPALITLHENFIHSNCGNKQ